MKCPRCESTSYHKNGRRNDKQSYLCKIVVNNSLSLHSLVP
ncbi:IS1/IS1595 family N-terminal zinc-binding domain-containing protein [Nostoc sp.]